MVSLYVISAEQAAGKTAIAAGLAKYLQGAGKRVGFLKPAAAGNNSHNDVAFMKQVLNLPEAVEALSPPAGDIKQIKESCDRISAGKDAVIIEDTLSQQSQAIAQAMGAKVIIIETYPGPVSQSIGRYKAFGSSLLGVVLNKVPVSQLKRVQDEATAQLSKEGVKVVGVLPEDRVLFTLTVGELADSIQGKILNNPEKSAELVENFMLGALVVDSGLSYFGRKENKAAVVRNDRPDMQLAALETPTRCLVLSGSAQPPVYSVLQKAQNKGIPIITTGRASSDIVTNIENALAAARFNQEKKLAKMSEIIRERLNLKALV